MWHSTSAASLRSGVTGSPIPRKTAGIGAMLRDEVVPRLDDQGRVSPDIGNIREVDIVAACEPSAPRIRSIFGAATTVRIVSSRARPSRMNDVVCRMRTRRHPSRGTPRAGSRLGSRGRRWRSHWSPGRAIPAPLGFPHPEEDKHSVHCGDGPRGLSTPALRYVAEKSPDTEDGDGRTSGPTRSGPRRPIASGHARS